MSTTAWWGRARRQSGPYYRWPASEVPTFIFFDEAESLFGRRDSKDSKSETSKTNQFLQEWDGLRSIRFRDSVVSIVLASNRTYAMDDAVLRRVPLRLLVDLPEVQDRKEILKIHTANETLGADVDLGQVASRTPMYSGSDLRNVVVDAAMRCIVDNVSHDRHTRRIICKTQLEAACDSIRPGVSKGAIASIRAFHAKFGNVNKLGP